MEMWQNYFFKLSELKSSAKRILMIWEELQNRMDGVELREHRSSDALMKMALGGLKGENFDEKALGLFYRDLYGISFDRGEVISRAKMIEREGEEIPEEALRVEVKVNKTDFIELVERMEDSLRGAFLRAKRLVEIPEAKEEGFSLDEPFIGVNVVRSFLEKALEISPASCRESFIILALNCISRRYMRIASEEFPEIGDESFEELRELFELAPLLEPELPTESRSKEYTIWGFPERTTGCFIFEMIGTLWEITELPFIQKYFRIESELKRYVERALLAWRKALPRGRIGTEAMKKLKELSSSSCYDCSRFGEVGNKITKKVYESEGIWTSWGDWKLEKISVKTGRGEMDFPSFIDCLSPSLFFKLGGFGEWTVKPSPQTMGEMIEKIRIWWTPIPE